MTGAPRLDITGAAPPSLDMTGAGIAPVLDMTGAPSLNITGAAPILNMTGAAPALNMTAAPPLLESTANAPPTIVLSPATKSGEDDFVNKTANLSLEDELDPFDPTTHAMLLCRLKTPLTSVHGYVPLEGNVPTVRTKSMLTLG